MPCSVKRERIDVPCSTEGEDKAVKLAMPVWSLCTVSTMADYFFRGKGGEGGSVELILFIFLVSDFGMPVSMKKFNFRNTKGHF